VAQIQRKQRTMLFVMETKIWFHFCLDDRILVPNNFVIKFGPVKYWTWLPPGNLTVCYFIYIYMYMYMYMYI
jgi:hypothetical protein